MAKNTHIVHFMAGSEPPSVLDMLDGTGDVDGKPGAVPCGNASSGRRVSPTWEGVTCEGCLATRSAKPPGKLQRTKRIKALMESQSFAQQAVSLLDCAAMVEALGPSLEPKRSVSTAVRVVRSVAEAVLADARSIAADGGTVLPPDVEESIERARRGAEARLAGGGS